MKIRKKISIPFVMLFCLFVGQVQAGPGIQVTAISTSPLNAPKVAAALGEWMNGAGKSSGSRLLLQQAIADGGNPTTHSIVSMYSSMAAAEAFSNKVQGDEGMSAEWTAFLGKMVPIVQNVATSRSAHVTAWGDIDDDNTVWLVHSFSVNDVPSMYRALDAYMKSDTGKKFPGEAHLFATIAGGANAPSHFLALGYESQAEMESWNEMTLGSADLRALLSSLQAVTEYHGANLAITRAAWGKSAKSVLKR